MHPPPRIGKQASGLRSDKLAETHASWRQQNKPGWRGKERESSSSTNVSSSWNEWMDGQSSVAAWPNSDIDCECKLPQRGSVSSGCFHEDCIVNCDKHVIMIGRVCPENFADSPASEKTVSSCWKGIQLALLYRKRDRTKSILVQPSKGGMNLVGRTT